MSDYKLSLALVKEYKLNQGQLPEFSRIDGYLFDDKHVVQYWVERKVRNNTFDLYPTAVVDYNKWMALIQIEQITNVPALLVYGWSCGTWGTLQPSVIPHYTTELLTPSLESVSLNAGVERKVVKVSTTEFKIRGNFND